MTTNNKPLFKKSFLKKQLPMYIKMASSLSLAVGAIGMGSYAFAQEPAADEQVEEVIVSGQRASIQSAQDVKRNSNVVVDSIVAEDIGKLPDRSVTEALQRVPGVTVGRYTNNDAEHPAAEGSGVAVRGLSQVRAELNGRDVFSAASGRGLSFEDVPAELMYAVDTYKSPSADMIEGGLGGTVNLRTRMPFDADGQQISLSAKANQGDQLKETNGEYSGLYSNRWETGAGEFGILVNASTSDLSSRSDQVYTRPYLPRTIDGDNVWVTKGVDWRRNDYQSTREGGYLALQWAPNDELEVTAEGFYTGYRNTSQNAMWFTNTLEHQNGNINIPLVYEGTNVVKEHQGYSNGGFQSGDYATGKTDSYLYALGAKWTPSDNVTVNSEIVYQDSKFTSDFFAMRFARTAYGLDVDYNDRNGVPSVIFKDNPATNALDESDMAAVGNWNASGMWDNGGGNQGDSTSVTTDVEWKLDGQFIQTVKVGGRFEQRNAQDFGRGQDSWSYAGTVTELMDDLVAAGASGDGSGLIFTVDDYFAGRANIFDSFITADGSYLLANADAVRSVYGLEKENVNKNFDVSEDSAALYATTKFNLSDAVSGEFGMRYVNYEQDMEFWSETGTNTNIFNNNTGTGKADKVLPSLVLNWNVTDDVVGRFAYTQTLRMPNFGDLNPLQYFQDPLTSIPYGTGSGGNPDLKPTESTNYDLSLEWYFAEGSSLYGALFKREIDGLVIGGKKTVNRTGNDGVTRDYVLTTLVNAADGELSGLEVGLVYFPDNLPTTLDGLGVQASFTLLDSSQKTPEYSVAGDISGYVDSKMSGVSDSSYSVVLAYDKDVFDARLSYVWREKFYAGNEAAIFANPIQFWRRPEQSLDLQVSYDVTDNFVVTFDATNLLDDVYQSYYGEGNEDLFNFGSAIYSKTYAVGVRYSF